MKKKYIKPSSMSFELATESMLAASVIVDRQDNVVDGVLGEGNVDVDWGASEDAGGSGSDGDGGYWGF